MTRELRPSDLTTTASSTPRRAPSPKISISIAPDVLSRLVEAAEAEGVTVSAWISRAAEDRLAIDDGLRPKTSADHVDGVLAGDPDDSGLESLPADDDARSAHS